MEEVNRLPILPRKGEPLTLKLQLRKALYSKKPNVTNPIKKCVHNFFTGVVNEAILAHADMSNLPHSTKRLLNVKRKARRGR